MVSRKLIKAKILLKQNIYALLIVILWFGSNFLYFLMLNGFDLVETSLVVFFFKDGPGLYGYFYDSFSEFIIFGILFSLITVELFRKYNPATTSLEMARKMEDHVVIIGYNNMGRRLSKYFDSKKIPYVIVEKDYDKIEDLIMDEQPAINDNAESKQCLIDAGVRKAKAVFVMADNLETQMVVNYNVRELNKKCKIIDRIFQDDIGDLISKTYDVKTISTSRYAARIVFEKIKEGNYSNILIIGMNHISARLFQKLGRADIGYKIIEEDEEVIEDLMCDGANIIIGDPKELAIMNLVNIREIDCVVILTPDATNSILITRRIRALNPDCKIISRIFLDSIAEILENEPFNCEVISSTKATLSTLIDKGILDF